MLLVTFKLENAHFGIDAHLVQEVVKVGELTTVHHAPSFVVGIRNLRGRIVTVVDLASRLGLGCVTRNQENRLLIMEWHNEPVGFLVDSVAEAVSLHNDEVSPPPSNIPEEQRRNLRGVYKDGPRLVGILDHEALFTGDEEKANTQIRKGEHR